MTTVEQPAGVGPLIREWRQRRRLSQLDLAQRAGISARHVSFVETGRAQPSRRMLLQLADHLEIPQRNRNTLLVAAGYAPVFQESAFDAARMSAVRAMVDRLFGAHEPFPALALDADENIVTMNGGARLLARELPDHLREPPVNLMRLTLHPEGLSKMMVNSAHFRQHMLGRLHRQVIHSGRPSLRRLYEEVSGYPGMDAEPELTDEVVTLLHVRALGTELRLFSTVTTFGASTDITVAELSLETFHPADEHTADVFRAAARQLA
ncbi:helix-turn-helix domain-containing protein [Streptomyces sp. NPDC054783]